MINGIIITCRLNSSRLPLKAIRKINNKEILIHIFDRLKNFNEKIILATTNNKEDDILCELANSKKIHIFRGSDNDVLLRLYNTAIKYKMDNFVHTTGDNIFIDIKSSKKMFKKHLENNYDFTEMVGLPWGGFTYALKTSSISKILKYKDDSNTELWHDYFRLCKEMNCGYWTSSFYSINKFSRYRITIDYERDLENIKDIFKKLKIKHNNTDFRKLLKFISDNKNNNKFFNKDNLVRKKIKKVKKKYKNKYN